MLPYSSVPTPGKSASSRGVRSTSPPSLGWMLLLAAALFSLALPVIGPLDDHHFAERAHNHEHVYLNGWPVQHDHAYLTGSTHPHTSPGDDASETAGKRPVDGMVFLSPVASGLMLAAINAPYHPAPEALRPPLWHSRNDNPLAGFVAVLRPPPGTHVPPALRPPAA